MKNKTEFSNVTKQYLTCFQSILDEMIQGMTSAELSDSISHNFIVQMIPHHRAAIAMSQNLLRYTTDIPLQNIALNIIEEQTKSICNMQEILCRCSGDCNTRQGLQTYQANVCDIMQNMFCDMKEACTSNNINISFMNEMIPHHQGAIQMSQNALCFPICPSLKPILEAIITSQRRGVCEMEQLLSCMRG
ncbi:MAG: DUF305 domain-containing protein [Roseburia sp.]|nr:DUF305 domain-containing protein [Roseburia sp.]